MDKVEIIDLEVNYSRALIDFKLSCGHACRKQYPYEDFFRAANGAEACARGARIKCPQCAAEEGLELAPYL